MKVLLLFKPNPEIVNTQQNIIPNGLLYIAALLLKNNIDAEVLNLAGKNWDECKQLIKEKAPSIVGIGCYTFNRNTCIKLAGIIKEINKEIKVVFGGPHSSIMQSKLMENCNDIDITVLNEGEITFLEIVERLKKGTSLESLPGIVYRANGNIINNSPRAPLENLDALPIPADYFKYKRIITSRGCPGRCIFCDTPKLWGQKVRLRSPKNVAGELEMLHKKYGICSFIISDDTFTFDKNRTIEICKEIINRGLKITWDCRSRVNFIYEERLRWMKKAGCVSVSYGIESGSQKILNTLKKGITTQQIREAAALTRKFGFSLNYFIIAGSPGETEETIKETIELIEETKPTAIFVYAMQLTPGTEIYEMAEKNGCIIDWISNKEEVIYFTNENSMEELIGYANKVQEFFNLHKKEFQYTEKELIEIINNEKGIQDLINLAHIKMRQKELDRAELIIDEALAINPNSTEALMNKGVILAIKKKKECIGFFNKSIKADPENLLAYKNLGLFLFKEKQYDDAISVFNQAIDIEPADVELYNSLGSAYGTIRDYPNAIAAFRKALKIEPNNQETIKNLKITIENK